MKIIIIWTLKKVRQIQDVWKSLKKSHLHNVNKFSRVFLMIFKQYENKEKKTWITFPNLLKSSSRSLSWQWWGKFPTNTWCESGKLFSVLFPIRDPPPRPGLAALGLSSPALLLTLSRLGWYLSRLACWPEPLGWPEPPLPPLPLWPRFEPPPVEPPPRALLPRKGLPDWSREVPPWKPAGL